MQRVPMMACQDRQGRAKNDLKFGINPVSGLAVTPKTASYTITAREYGCCFSNEGAAGSVTFTLPTAFAGAKLIFLKPTAQNIVLDGAGSDTIGLTTGGTAAATLSNTNTQPTASIMLYAVSATQWLVENSIGTWA